MKGYHPLSAASPRHFRGYFRARREAANVSDTTSKCSCSSAAFSLGRFPSILRPMHRSRPSLNSSPHHPQLYCLKCWQGRDPRQTGNQKLGGDDFGISVLLEYGMRIAVY